MDSHSSALALSRRFDEDDDSGLLAALVAYAARMQTTSSGRGSSTGRQPNIDRRAAEAHEHLIRDYFADTPMYSARTFRQRFRMQRALYLRIVRAVEAHDSYFQQRCDATGKLGLSALQKCTATIRQLAYGLPADAVDEYIRIGESTAIKSLLWFCAASMELFGYEYLRAPTEEDVQRLREMHARRGFVGMLGSLDCMHWTWKNCPTAWAGQYTGKEKKPTIVLEAVASSDLWIWPAFFGMPGSHNDINVLDRSDLFSGVTNLQEPPCNYTINGTNYDLSYYLADGIYPPCATLVQTVSNPKDNKQKHFARKQESARKDVERAFGVLQARWAIIKGPARFWSHTNLSAIMKTCIILHNIIVEDERGEDLPHEYHQATTLDFLHEDSGADVTQFVARHRAIRSEAKHTQLQRDLMEHLWQLQGNSSD